MLLGPCKRASCQASGQPPGPPLTHPSLLILAHSRGSGLLPEVAHTGWKFPSHPPDVPTFLPSPVTCSKETMQGEDGLREPRHG